MLALASCEEGFQHWTHLPWTTYDRMDFLGCALMSNAEYCNCRLLALLFAFLLRRLVEIAFIGEKKKKNNQLASFSQVIRQRADLFKRMMVNCSPDGDERLHCKGPRNSIFWPDQVSLSKMLFCCTLTSSQAEVLPDHPSKWLRCFYWLA